jgi:hypothetical protein
MASPTQHQKGMKWKVTYWQKIQMSS